ncbi:UDP-2,3-diacylglucosamine diphosphatase [Aromatoleum petrolei]|uniref:UDP-2,3-diacylglucosamine hydrolase n=1 Tax=Aromatoleum petrolei TaxID=76116 RepID=A0ABX1ML56_9RHOO|nr:UDP-2,3-diacylglucosamine diphosphatase [Aromatoleum petrolei]NMF88702.1 UDP-2,3-diacylglucosamine diphosphatase [Aromatoleum petrolei]QTQ37876.1 UDP-2,3-diacylglucosamine hydrolase [Aromatoleum petrolei]
MSALFIADLHLSENCPDNTRAFLELVDGKARELDALYILGDLFEYWAGDDDRDAPLNREVAGALASLAAGGTRVGFVAGNRDFLVGADFARAAGLTILPDPTEIDLDGRRVLITHGDSLCTDDHAYQAFRRQVRDPQWQQAFIARPLAERRMIIEGLRKHSETAKQEKAEEIMDVNTAAVDALLRAHDYPILIHGHTHRPAHHLHHVDGRQCERWVLSDWRGTASWLSWEGKAFHPGP